LVSIKNITYGIGSGYIQKAVQIVTTIIIIPLLISDTALGLSGYGELMTALAIVAFFSMILDGVRLSVARKVGQQQNANNHGLGVSIAVMLVALSVPVSVFALIADTIFEFTGLDWKRDSVLMVLLLLFLFFEQLNYVVEQYYHSKGLTWKVNVITTLEVLVRFAIISFAIIYYMFDAEMYLYIFVGSYIIKSVYFFANLYGLDAFNKNSMSFKWDEVTEILNYSWPLSLKGVATFFVYRFGVIVCNKVIGSEASAIYSIIFTTIKSYLTQLFVAVLRPMVVPIMAAKNISKISNENKESITSTLRVYEYIVVGAILFVSFSSEIWLGAWLGDEFLNYSMLFSISIMIVSLEVVSGIKALLLVSQGYGRQLSFYSLLFASFVLLMLTYIMITGSFSTLENIIYLTLSYIVIYNGVALMRLFRRYMLGIDKDNYLVRMFVYVTSGLSFYMAYEYSVYMGLVVGMLVYVVLVMALFKGVYQDLIRVFKVFMLPHKT